MAIRACIRKLIISHHSFKVGDVALFLPTRNSSGKPWAAFNISAPHYFLKPSESVAFQMNTREWIVARITSITEHVVNAQVSEKGKAFAGRIGVLKAQSRILLQTHTGWQMV